MKKHEPNWQLCFPSLPPLAAWHFEAVTGRKPSASFMLYPNRELSRPSLGTTSWSVAGTVAGSLPLTCWCVRCQADLWVLTWSATIRWLVSKGCLCWSILEMMAHRWLNHQKQAPIPSPTNDVCPWTRVVRSHWGSEFLRKKRPLARDHWSSWGNARCSSSRCDQFQRIHQFLRSVIFHWSHCMDIWSNHKQPPRMDTKPGIRFGVAFS